MENKGKLILTRYPCTNGMTEVITWRGMTDQEYRRRDNWRVNENKDIRVHEFVVSNINMLYMYLFIYVVADEVTNTHTHTHTHTHTYIYMYMCVCVCVWCSIEVLNAWSDYSQTLHTYD